MVAVVQCLLLGVDGAGARSLPLGTTLPHVEIGAGETQLYEFEKTGDVPEGVETIVLRATREQVLRDEAEAVRLCFGVNATPADCAASGESFELWLEYNTLVENTTYVVGFYSSVALRYTMRSCISTCTQLCPNDCNGKFVSFPFHSPSSTLSFSLTFTHVSQRCVRGWQVPVRRDTDARVDRHRLPRGRAALPRHGPARLCRVHHLCLHRCLLSRPPVSARTPTTVTRLLLHS